MGPAVIGVAAAPPRETGAWGQMEANEAAEIVALRFEVGGTGACHRNLPIGGSA